MTIQSILKIFASIVRSELRYSLFLAKVATPNTELMVLIIQSKNRNANKSRTSGKRASDTSINRFKKMTITEPINAKINERNVLE